MHQFLRRRQRRRPRRAAGLRLVLRDRAPQVRELAREGVLYVPGDRLALRPWLLRGRLGDSGGDFPFHCVLLRLPLPADRCRSPRWLRPRRCPRLALLHRGLIDRGLRLLLAGRLAEELGDLLFKNAPRIRSIISRWLRRPRPIADRLKPWSRRRRWLLAAPLQPAKNREHLRHDPERDEQKRQQRLEPVKPGGKQHAGGEWELHHCTEAVPGVVPVAIVRRMSVSA